MGRYVLADFKIATLGFNLCPKKKAKLSVWLYVRACLFVSNT